MKKGPNYKGGKCEAYKEFIKDLHQDKDFIEFKRNANRLKEEGFSYGVVIVRGNKFTIEQLKFKQ